MANTSIDLVGLDFTTIKSNLKTYLKNNSAFKDVDFEGSNINVLIDLLSYNTYLNSFYTNMVASEMFLDSAQLRDSVVSHAKSLNYTPRSFVSSKADIQLNITPSTTVSNIVVPKGTSFTSRVGSNTYTFSTDSNLILNSSVGGTFSANVELYEGFYVTDTFVFNYSNTSQRFILSNPTIDTTSLSVTVIEDNGDSTLSFSKAENLVGITSTSKTYFLQAAENQQYEIVFGNNVFGRKPKDGSVVIAEYRNCSGELSNGASLFRNDGNIDGHSNVSIVTINNSSGGSVSEDIESIRFNASRNFQIQSRAVTSTDYESILKSNFPEIESISAYGGEELIPPKFGKVYIAVDIQNADGVPLNRIRAYSQFLKDKTPLSIDTVFITPEFMYVQVVSNVSYNVNVSSKLSNDIRTLVLSKISSYNTNNLNGFKKTLYYSKFVREIDSADESIVGNSTEIRAIKSLSPTLNVDNNYDIDFGFPLSSEEGLDLKTDETHYGHTITSSVFTFNGYRSKIIDDSIGNLYIAKLTTNLAEIERRIGSVDYRNGLLTISKFNISQYDGSAVKIYAKPLSKDITSSKNVILTISDEDISLTVTPVKV